MIKAIRLSLEDLQPWLLETDIQVGSGQRHVDQDSLQIRDTLYPRWST